jgi:hypothetical protein
MRIHHIGEKAITFEMYDRDSEEILTQMAKLAYQKVKKEGPGLDGVALEEAVKRRLQKRLEPGLFRSARVVLDIEQMCGKEVGLKVYGVAKHEKLPQQLYTFLTEKYDQTQGPRAGLELITKALDWYAKTHWTR